MRLGSYWAFAILTILMLLALTRCAQVPVLDRQTYYKRDMQVQINDVQGSGVAVAPRAPSYDIVITSLDDMDLLQISSCARDVDIPNAIKSQNGIQGLWKKSKRSYEFTYTPGRIEQMSGCPLKLGGYNKAEGQHSWGYIEFEETGFKLDAGISCNGAADYTSPGVSVCQTLENLYAEIWFAPEVVLSTKTLDRCKIDSPADKRHFTFQVKPKECIYDFMETKVPYRRHRLTTIGYEAVPIRNNP
jgi:hypothetical protein